MALITGGIASGKTELLGYAADAAAAAGALVVTAVGSRAERTLQFSVLGQLFHGVDLPDGISDRVAELLNEETLTAGTAAGEPLTVGHENARAVHGLSMVLLELARKRPVVVCVDDVQFADSPSLQVLLYLQQRIRSANMLIVLTEWATSHPTHPVFRAEIARQPYFHRIRLNPLTRRGVAGLLAAHLDTPAANRHAAACWRISGGNPLLVKALIADHRDAAARSVHDAPELVVGEEFGEAVIACLNRWDPILLTVARGIAVLGESSPASAKTLGRLLGIKADSATQSLDVLTLAGLLDSAGRYRHPSAAAAVLDSLGPEDRGRMHQRAADLLYQDRAPVAQIARHLITADQVHSPWAIGVLRETAETALADDNVDFAVTCLELAYRGSSDRDERVEITTALARLEWRSNPAATTESVARLNAALRDGQLSDQNLLALIKFLLSPDHPAEAGVALNALVESAGAPDNPFAAELHLVHHLLSFSHPPLFPRRPHALTDPAAGDAISTAVRPWTRAVTSLLTVLTEGPGANADAAADHVLHSFALDDETIDALLLALLALVYSDRLATAARWCDALIEEASSRRAKTWEALLSNIGADIALRQGDLPLAADRARAALSRIPAQGWGASIGSPLASLIMATTAMGEFGAAAAALKQAVPKSMAQTWFAPQYLRARGHYLLATNHLTAALNDFESCGALMTKWNIDQPALAPWRRDAALVHLRLGEPEAASELITQQLRIGGSIGPRTKGASLRVLAEAADPDQRPHLLAEAAQQLRSCGDRFELALTLADLGEVYHRLGDSAKAREVTQQAVQAARSCEAAPLQQRLAAVQTTVGGGTPADEPDENDGLAALSDAEWRVASLASLRHTNRAISRKLSITESTVEQHLTRIYRKLKIDSRTQLPEGLPFRRTAWAAEVRRDHAG
ncbi:transcriptional regulator NarL [Amycolatopsis sp. YIM 10]|nr:transcriptional regulator NarL [Amycolatopsis sp. YIM 10]